MPFAESENEGEEAEAPGRDGRADADRTPPAAPARAAQPAEHAPARTAAQPSAAEQPPADARNARRRLTDRAGKGIARTEEMAKS